MSDNAGTWHKVAKVGDIAAGEIFGAEIGDTSVALYNLDGTFYATDNICTHAFAMLSDGWVSGEEVECPLHGGRFEIKTGKALGDPVECDITTFPVRVVGEDVEVLIPEK
jgi:nitrite reductase/ring-hydroxylating ferredoxin subunit